MKCVIYSVVPDLFKFYLKFYNILFAVLNSLLYKISLLSSSSHYSYKDYVCMQQKKNKLSNFKYII